MGMCGIHLILTTIAIWFATMTISKDDEVENFIKSLQGEYEPLVPRTVDRQKNAALNTMRGKESVERAEDMWKTLTSIKENCWSLDTRILRGEQVRLPCGTEFKMAPHLVRHWRTAKKRPVFMATVWRHYCSDAFIDNCHRPVNEQLEQNDPKIANRGKFGTEPGAGLADNGFLRGMPHDGPIPKTDPEAKQVEGQRYAEWLEVVEGRVNKRKPVPETLLERWKPVLAETDTSLPLLERGWKKTEKWINKIFFDPVDHPVVKPDEGNEDDLLVLDNVPHTWLFYISQPTPEDPDKTRLINDGRGVNAWAAQGYELKVTSVRDIWDLTAFAAGRGDATLERRWINQQIKTEREAVTWEKLAEATMDNKPSCYGGNPDPYTSLLWKVDGKGAYFQIPQEVPLHMSAYRPSTAEEGKDGRWVRLTSVVCPMGLVWSVFSWESWGRLMSQISLQLAAPTNRYVDDLIGASKPELAKFQHEEAFRVLNFIGVD